ncbi:hypothetical protein HMPREF9018_1525 [Prevotella amnii CRIS 21A-A]|uniref:Uncharacterized protein n=1 Tax=Prevotella amnii CRIS 21A-A TaxID=679191 RepID=E1GT34_9BACT|nr:hypothetical protein HMPREF9018_1525 [Prevotella amnii CRIS 21A-A]
MCKYVTHSFLLNTLYKLLPLSRRKMRAIYLLIFVITPPHLLNTFY